MNIAVVSFNARLATMYDGTLPIFKYMYIWKDFIHKVERQQWCALQFNHSYHGYWEWNERLNINMINISYFLVLN